MRDPLREDVFAALDELHPGGPIGLAVSGGGDSMAMLSIAHRWAAARETPLFVASIDHGLRAESADEAADVGRFCAQIGRSCDVLRWSDWNGRGNLQAAARAARRRLLSEWAASREVAAVALGHTLDDQAETVLMRLARGSGVDGLSGMAPSARAGGVLWLRPLLGQRREALRDWLTAQGVAWVDDPSNENPRFDRVRARRALASLADVGITAEGLATTATRMRSAREGLDHAVTTLAKEAAQWGICGELRLSLAPLRAAPTELSRRLLRAGLIRAAGAEYGPRADAEAKLMTAMLGLRLGGGRSLHGCLIRPDGPGGVVISREAAALPQAPRVFDADDAVWDGRFVLAAKAPTGDAVLAPLGASGDRRLENLRDEGLWSPPPGWSEAPRAARMATPALWRRDTLAAAPVAAYGNALAARFVGVEMGWLDPSGLTA